MTIAMLEQALEGKRTEGLALLDKTARAAEAENREWTDEERTALKAIETDGQALKAKLQQAKGDAEIADQLEKLVSPLGGKALAPRPRLSMGEQFVRSEAYQFFRQKLHRSSSAWRSPSVELYAETLTEDAASGGKLVVPQYLPGIQPLLFKRLTVADLLSPGTTDSNAIIYMKETVFTNNAAAVAEAAEKPESVLRFDQVTEAVRKIAHWLPVSEEMLEDVAQIRSYIDARLRLGVQLEEEDQLLNGDGTAPNISGILDRAGLATSIVRTNPDTNADALLKQAMAIFASAFLMPDGFVLNPVNWTSTILLKTTTGEYLAGGPFSPMTTPTLWGLPVAVTPSIVANTGLVGAFKMGAQVFRHGGIRVEASNSHADFFIKNLVAIRAEERLALAVYREGAFGTVTALT